MKKYFLFSLMAIMLSTVCLAQTSGKSEVVNDAVETEVKAKSSEVFTQAQEVAIPEPSKSAVPSGDIPLPPPVSQWNAKDLFTQLFDPFYAAALLILSYLSYAIPGINKLKENLARVVTLGVILAIGFIFFGKDFWQVAFSYIITNISYFSFFKAFLKTPKVPVAAPN